MTQKKDHIQLKVGPYPIDGQTGLLTEFGELPLVFRGFVIHGHTWLAVKDVAWHIAGKADSSFLRDRIAKLSTPEVECRCVVLTPKQRFPNLRTLLCARVDMLINLIYRLMEEPRWKDFKSKMEQTLQILGKLYRGNVRSSVISPAQMPRQDSSGVSVVSHFQPDDTPPPLPAEPQPALKGVWDPATRSSKQSRRAEFAVVAQRVEVKAEAQNALVEISGAVYNFQIDAVNRVRCATFEQDQLVALQDVGILASCLNYKLLARLLLLAGARVYAVKKLVPAFLVMADAEPILMGSIAQLSDLFMHHSVFSPSLVSVCNNTSRYLASLLPTPTLAAPAADVAALSQRLAEATEMLVQQQQTLARQAVQLKELQESATLPVGNTSFTRSVAEADVESGLNVGRNKLFSLLREHGVLISTGARKNLPKKAFIKNGLFAIREQRSPTGDGETVPRWSTTVTDRGVRWLRKKFGNTKEAETSNG